METALQTDFQSIMISMSKVDSRTAECFTPEDQEMIHTALERSVGHSEMNERITSALHR